MKKTIARAERPAHKKKSCARPSSNAMLDRMIEEAIVDAYGESEQLAGFYTMLDDNLTVPFQTVMLDVEVIVERIDMTDDDQIVAVCARGKSRQRVPILDLPLPDPPPDGAEWIDAFRKWARENQRWQPCRAKGSFECAQTDSESGLKLPKAKAVSR
jgi:hypothetical protein